MFEGLSFANTMLVTLAGILIVFIVLGLLIGILYIFGSVSNSAAKKDNAKKNSKSEQGSENKAKPTVSKAVKTEAAYDDGELVAVITAAAMSVLSGDGKKYAVRSIRPAGEARTVWATAGIIENTRPF